MLLRAIAKTGWTLGKLGVKYVVIPMAVSVLIGRMLESPEERAAREAAIVTVRN